MTRPTILAIIEEGPRAGKTIHLDAEAEDHPPKEFLLPDEHLGARPADRRTPPSGSVSNHLVGRDEERSGYIYKVELTGSTA